MQFRNYQLYTFMAVLLPLQAVAAEEYDGVLEEITVTGSRANFSSAQDAPVPAQPNLDAPSRWLLLLSTSQAHQSVTARMHCARRP